jgi:hypothetical protein
MWTTLSDCAPYTGTCFCTECLGSDPNPDVEESPPEPEPEPEIVKEETKFETFAQLGQQLREKIKEAARGDEDVVKKHPFLVLSLLLFSWFLTSLTATGKVIRFLYVWLGPLFSTAMNILLFVGFFLLFRMCAGC